MVDEEINEKIMKATYTALCKKGYADLTMQHIAKEAQKSKSTLHYHYNTKKELFDSFLEYLYINLETKLQKIQSGNPVDQLDETLDFILDYNESQDYPELQIAILEIKTQAPYNKNFRKRLKEFDKLLCRHFEEIIKKGKHQNFFKKNIDEKNTARFITTLINGFHTRKIAIGNTDNSFKNILSEYIKDYISKEKTDNNIL